MNDDDNEQTETINIFDECDGFNFKNGYTLRDLKAMFQAVPKVHFFEEVMCSVLGLRLRETMNLEQFVKYVLVFMACKPTQCFSSSELPVLERKIRTTSSECRTTVNKQITVHHMVDGFMSYSMYEIETRREAEFKFLQSLKELVRGGDVSGIPLLLNGEEESGQIKFYIPDYGYNLLEYLRTYTYDNSMLVISLLAVSSCLPATNTDQHERNICLCLPQIPFRYKWTLQMSTFVAEICWNFSGIITFIDWEHYVDAGKKCSCSSASWLYRSDHWKMKFHSERLGVDADFDGEEGMWQLLNLVFRNVSTDKLTVKFCKTSVFAKNPIASVLEVYPDFEGCCGTTDGLNLDPKVLNRLNERMSRHGGAFRMKDKLTRRDLNCISSVYHDIAIHGTKLSYNVRSMCPIPSDTGLVALKMDGTLIATQDIAEHSIVTFLPTSKRIQFLSRELNPSFEVGVYTATVIKKISPFVGFGGFTKWDNEEKANCLISVETFPPSKFRLFALRAKRLILKGDEIVCSNSFIKPPQAYAISESLPELMNEIQANIQAMSLNTRSRSLSDAE